ncbi:MAG: hypothetical protein ACI8XM_002533, partial [Haloarculaceae archaeon]
MSTLVECPPAMEANRRRFLSLGALTAAGILAGCASDSDSEPSTATETPGSGGATPTAEATDTPTEQDTDTPTADDSQQYGWQAATFDSYWYSLYNMSTNIAMSGNGVVFPANDEQRQTFQQRIRGITRAADVDGPPINNPNLNMAPFTTGDPHFTQQPVFEDDTGRPDAS